MPELLVYLFITFALFACFLVPYIVNWYIESEERRKMKVGRQKRQRR